VKSNRLVVSDAAAADIVEQADWYSTQSGSALAERWENCGGDRFLFLERSLQDSVDEKVFPS
jgi:hypothetical protein